jgi:hypothetical protein
MESFKYSDNVSSHWSITEATACNSALSTELA